MLPSWKDEAYLIYHVFAGMQARRRHTDHPLPNSNAAKGQSLSSVARLSESRRNAFITATVGALKLLEAPTRIEGVSRFNPTRILGSLIPRTRCDVPNH
jgi:hypothetical protein